MQHASNPQHAEGRCTAKSTTTTLAIAIFLYLAFFPFIRNASSHCWEYARTRKSSVNIKKNEQETDPQHYTAATFMYHINVSLTRRTVIVFVPHREINSSIGIFTSKHLYGTW